MTNKEKILYHQIHPLKLITDISTGFFTTYLLWQHNLFLFSILFLLPSVIVTLILVKFFNLEKQRKSKLGKYVSKFMPPLFQSIRLFGQVIMWVSAWYQSGIFVFIGFLVIVFGWSKGLISKN